MVVNEWNVREWVDRFLEGMTTNAEEAELYRFFEKGNVPKDLEKYRQMFQWYAGGMQGDPRVKHSNVGRIIRLSLKIAASVVFVCGLGLIVYHFSFQKKYEFLEGSYIIRGGKKITDLKSILPELRKMNKLAAQQEMEIEVIDHFDVDKYIDEMENGQTEQSEDLPII